MTVAALFVETDGVYYGLPDVETWDESRDARLYAGPHSVVAHPPFQRWGALAAVNFSRWGGEHNRPGNDGGCFASALRSVIAYGGVIEHPAKSRAFSTYGILPPRGKGWNRLGRQEWVCEVWQSAYGHRANKATWLFYSGVLPPFDLDWRRPRGEFQVGFHDQRGKRRNKPTLSPKEARRTPELFRDALLSLAKEARP